ncbi:CPBP family intramembrane glutamic endopeptidase [Geodermatophilus sp. URMC 65]
MIIATVLAAVEGGRAQAATLWRRSVDVPAARYAGWVAAVALLPALVLLATLLDHGSGTLPPAPVPPAAVPLLVVVYLAAALAEEVGWTAYLTDRVLLRLGTAGTGLVLGAVWAAWHLVPYLQVGRDAGWIVWQCLGTVAARVLIVEVYAGSGHCVPTAVVMHAGLNVATAALPGAGPDLDPAPVAAVLSVAAVATGLLRAWRDGRSRRHGRAASGGRRRRSHVAERARWAAPTSATSDTDASVCVRPVPVVIPETPASRALTRAAGQRPDRPAVGPQPGPRGLVRIAGRERGAPPGLDHRAAPRVRLRSHVHVDDAVCRVVGVHHEPSSGVRGPRVDEAGGGVDFP